MWNTLCFCFCQDKTSILITNIKLNSYNIQGRIFVIITYEYKLYNLLNGKKDTKLYKHMKNRTGRKKFQFSTMTLSAHQCAFYGYLKPPQINHKMFHKQLHICSEHNHLTTFFSNPMKQILRHRNMSVCLLKVCKFPWIFKFFAPKHMWRNQNQYRKHCYLTSFLQISLQ